MRALALNPWKEGSYRGLKKTRISPRWIAEKIRRYGEFSSETAKQLYEGTNEEILKVFGENDRLEKSLAKDVAVN